jgi:hypothetical protein
MFDKKASREGTTQEIILKQMLIYTWYEGADWIQLA